MSNRDPSFVSFGKAYRPWGQVRRKSLIARLTYAMTMILLGVATVAIVALLIVFAASIVAIGVVALGLMALAAFFTRKPAKVRVRTQDNGKGVYEARKSGSTWIVY